MVTDTLSTGLPHGVEERDRRRCGRRVTYVLVGAGCGNTWRDIPVARPRGRRCRMHEHLQHALDGKRVTDVARAAAGGDRKHAAGLVGRANQIAGPGAPGKSPAQMGVLGPFEAGREAHDTVQVLPLYLLRSLK